MLNAAQTVKFKISGFINKGENRMRLFVYLLNSAEKGKLECSERLNSETAPHAGHLESLQLIKIKLPSLCNKAVVKSLIKGSLFSNRSKWSVVSMFTKSISVYILLKIEVLRSSQ